MQYSQDVKPPTEGNSMDFVTSSQKLSPPDSTGVKQESSSPAPEDLLRNKEMEWERKSQKYEEDLAFQKGLIGNLNQQIQHLSQQQVAAPSSQAPSQQPQISDDQLWELVEGSPEYAPAARAEIQRRMEARIENRLTNKILPQAQIANQKQYFEQKTIEDFPEIQDRTGKFFEAVRKEYHYVNQTLPDAVYIAAKQAAKKMGIGAGNQQLNNSRLDKLGAHMGQPTATSSQQESDKPAQMSNKQEYESRMFVGSDDKEHLERTRKVFADIRNQKTKFAGGKYERSSNR